MERSKFQIPNSSHNSTLPLKTKKIQETFYIINTFVMKSSIFFYSFDNNENEKNMYSS